MNYRFFFVPSSEVTIISPLKAGARCGKQAHGMWIAFSLKQLWFCLTVLAHFPALRRTRCGERRGNRVMQYKCASWCYSFCKCAELPCFKQFSLYGFKDRNVDNSFYDDYCVAIRTDSSNCLCNSFDLYVMSLLHMFTRIEFYNYNELRQLIRYFK